MQAIEDIWINLRNNDAIEQNYNNLNDFIEDFVQTKFVQVVLDILEQNKNKKELAFRQLEEIYHLCVEIHPKFKFYQLFTDKAGALIALRLFKMSLVQVNALREQILKCVFNRTYLLYGKNSLHFDLQVMYETKPFTAYNLHAPSFCYFMIELNYKYMIDKYNYLQPYKYFTYFISTYDDEKIVKPILNYFMSDFKPFIGDYAVNDTFQRIDLDKFNRFTNLLIDCFQNYMDDLDQFYPAQEFHNKLGINFGQIEEDSNE